MPDPVLAKPPATRVAVSASLNGRWHRITRYAKGGKYRGKVEVRSQRRYGSAWNDVTDAAAIATMTKLLEAAERAAADLTNNTVGPTDG